MLIEKYVFYLPQALDLLKKRMSLNKCLNQHELFVLYACKKLHIVNSSNLYRYGIKLGTITNRVAIHRAIKSLKTQGLIISGKGLIEITPKGRDFLHGIRRNLLNKRLTF